ncbi:MAG: response regulator [Promethearchaeota archaeon]
MDILVVDDNIRFLDTISRTLTTDGHSVVTATSGEEALIKAKHQTFDLILADLKMEGMTGTALIKELRRSNINTITIIITGYGTISSAVEAMKTGAYDYILKPFDYVDLSTKITEVERELDLRKSTIMSIGEKTEIEELHQLNIDEYQSPFLVISDDEEIIKKYKIPKLTSIWFSHSKKGENIVSPSKLHILRDHIAQFVKSHEKGTIIFKGIEKLLKIHSWNDFKYFISYLQKEVLSEDFILLFLTKKRNDDWSPYYEFLLYDALSNLSAQAFNSIIEVVSSLIRKKIITLLKLKHRLNFNAIAKELSIKNTSILAFHLKKLGQEIIVEKEDNDYLLTTRGHYYAEIIVILEKLGLADPASQVKALEYSES